ncbi:hypothetical protein OROMI_016291 [Orobanche minor]
MGARLEVDWVVSHLRDFQNALLVLNSTDTTSFPRINRWVTDIEFSGNVLKVAAWFDESRSLYSVSVAVLNTEHRLIAAMGRQIAAPGTVLCAELAAMVEGIRWYIGFCSEELNMVSDSMDALHALNVHDDYHGPEGVVITELTELLATVQVRGLFHIARKDNILAHSLARFASSNSVPQALFESGFPFWIEEYAQDEAI